MTLYIKKLGFLTLESHMFYWFDLALHDPTFGLMKRAERTKMMNGRSKNLFMHVWKLYAEKLENLEFKTSLRKKNKVYRSRAKLCEKNHFILFKYNNKFSLLTYLINFWLSVKFTVTVYPIKHSNCKGESKKFLQLTN